MRAARDLRVAAAAGLLAGVIAISIAPVRADAQGLPPSTSPLSAHRVNDAIAGGWLGEVVAGARGYRTEFDFNGRIVPRRAIPPYRPKFTNRYTFGGGVRAASDETYVEIPLIEALRRYGLQADWAQLAQPFAASRFLLFGANDAARKNLGAGLLPPDSGAPAHNPYSHEIDFQIESDFIGMAAPAQPGAAVEMAWRLGHIMNYGDGVYGGVMVSAMHAAAFRAKGIDEIVAAGQAAVPEGTAYRRMIDDVISWHRLYPGNWRTAWNLLEQNWDHPDPTAPHPGELPGINVAASLNGGYMLLGLLYGRGNFERTIKIAIQAGQDTDCNASNAASVLGTWLGRSRIPKRFRGVAMNRRIAGTDYTLARAISVNRQLAAALTTSQGGTVARRKWQIAPHVLQSPAFEQRVAGEAPPAIGPISVETTGRTARFRMDAAADIRDIWWSFGDLSGAHGPDVSHTYLQPGNYRVNVWVANASGTTTHRELTVTIP
jgi:hypothetical protein